METIEPHNSTVNPVAEDPQQSNATQSSNSPLLPDTSKQKNLLPLIIAATIIVLGISVYAIYTFLSTSVTIGTPEPIETPKKVEVIPTIDTSTPVESDSINFSYQVPKVENLTIFKKSTDEMGVDSESTVVKLIGTSEQWKLYAVEVKFYGPGFYTPVDYLISDGFRSIYIPVSNNDEWALEDIKSSLLPDIEVMYEYKGLPVYPKSFGYKGLEFESPTSLLNINEFSSPELVTSKIDTVNDYDLSKSYAPIKGFTDEINPNGNQESKLLKGFYSRQVFLAQPVTNFGKFYSPFFKFMSKDNKAIAKFNDKRSSESVYSPNADICGGYAFGIKVIKSSEIDESELKEVGKTNEGEVLYQITSKENDVLSNLYYNEYRYSRTGINDEEPLSFDKFITLPTHFLYKDAIGDYVLFANEDYGSLAECGKPVVYLYPEKTENVSVQVDAAISKSDPEYGSGWNVTAQPNGIVSYNGREYPYLYWDGLGNGTYPSLNGYGYVIETTKAESVIRSHLKQQGLNEKEINDFVEYWIPLMPSTKYVRITWIGTNDMNRLAELTINPKPDTLIRVFMDYEGQNTYESLKPQQFVAPERNGFTVVEWGGLLR